jgi:hypothetical protein
MRNFGSVTLTSKRQTADKIRAEILKIRATIRGLQERLDRVQRSLAGYRSAGVTTTPEYRGLVATSRSLAQAIEEREGRVGELQELLRDVQSGQGAGRPREVVVLDSKGSGSTARQPGFTVTDLQSGAPEYTPSMGLPQDGDEIVDEAVVEVTEEPSLLSQYKWPLIGLAATVSGWLGFKYVWPRLKK